MWWLVGALCFVSVVAVVFGVITIVNILGDRKRDIIGKKSPVVKKEAVEVIIEEPEDLDIIDNRQMKKINIKTKQVK